MEAIKILIVEDELLIAENLAIKLKNLNYQVVDIVSSGNAAIAKSKSHHPDLILMDIAIKGELDGIQTAELITESQPDIAIIFLTAYSDDKTLERASLTGCYGYILKPYKNRELHAAIKIALKKHQQQKLIQNSLTEVTELLAEYSAEKSHIYEDDITKLPNQLMLRELFTYLLASINNSASQQETSNEPNSQSSNKKKLLAVIYLRPYKFERIIASLGNKSDLLLVAIAKRLTEIINNLPYQCATVKMQNSDFAILLTDLEQRHLASDFAQDILEQFRQPFIIEQQKIFVTLSVGIAFYPFDNLQVEKLTEQAKQAMVYAENQGSGKYHLYTSAFRIMNADVTCDLSLEADLHQAIENNQLELYYQPKINLSTGKIESSEALLRWNHPELGMVLPGKILPLAEVTGLTDRLGNWVLKTACQQTKKLHQSGFDFLKIAINLSGHQFQQSDLFHQLTQILFEFDLEPQFLELELTEQILVENAKSNIQKLNLIKNLGATIALDDFGTGYSSLSYLHQFPFDILKIDRRFISNIHQNQKNAVIVKSVIEMAHQLNLLVVAEGVETQSELDFIVHNHCDEVQGYFFARPLPVVELEKLLTTDKTFSISQDKIKVMSNE